MTHGKYRRRSEAIWIESKRVLDGRKVRRIGERKPFYSSTAVGRGKHEADRQGG
jgi:hypothetical protein